MQLSQDHPLNEYNTFGISATARRFTAARSVAELEEILSNVEPDDLFIIGGGSNMLLTQEVVDKTVVLMRFKGIELLQETEDHVMIRVMAGENWHSFVLHCISLGYGGLENLSLIPGNVGAAPIQNIGAYGVEIKDTFISCEALDLHSLEYKTFTKEDCQFGYRESFFKQEGKGRYIITSVTFKLTRKNHRINTSYGTIESFLEEKGIAFPDIKDVAEAVVAIRQSKLPDPEKIGNCGSFFKNPVIARTRLSDLQEKFPTIPHYPVSDSKIKIPAGWLIEQAGCKEYKIGDAGVYPKQALVLVNNGAATGADILLLSQHIQKAVREQFEIDLQTEVNIF